MEYTLTKAVDTNVTTWAGQKVRGIVRSVSRGGYEWATFEVLFPQNGPFDAAWVRVGTFAAELDDALSK